jgi:hypothetical protein
MWKKVNGKWITSHYVNPAQFYVEEISFNNIFGRKNCHKNVEKYFNIFLQFKN